MTNEKQLEVVKNQNALDIALKLDYSAEGSYGTPFPTIENLPDVFKAAKEIKKFIYNE